MLGPQNKIENRIRLNEFLKQQIKESEDFRFIHRLHCVLLVEQGKNIGDVAELFGDDASSIARWVRNYNEFGVLGLHDDNKTGRPSKISFDQFKEIKIYLQKHPVRLGYRKSRWDGALLKEFLHNNFDVQLSLRQCQRLLSNMKNDSDFESNYL